MSECKINSFICNIQLSIPFPMEMNIFFHSNLFNAYTKLVIRLNTCSVPKDKVQFHIQKRVPLNCFYCFLFFTQLPLQKPWREAIGVSFYAGLQWSSGDCKNSVSVF